MKATGAPNEIDSLDAAMALTLQAIAKGGIYDPRLGNHG